MIALLMGLVSGAVVLRALGFRRRWPWRAARLRTDLEAESCRVSRRASMSLPDLSGSQRPADVGRSRRIRSRSLRIGFRRIHSHQIRLAPFRPDISSSGLSGSVPLTVELLLVAASSGHSIHGAIEAVASVDSTPVGSALSELWRRFCGGSSLSDGLHSLPTIMGEELRPLCNVLLSGLRSGAPIEGALRRLADHERRKQRSRIEERVRRLPVLMLAPLVLLVLPSFVLIAIAPVLLSAVDGLGI